MNKSSGKAQYKHKSLYIYIYMNMAELRNSPDSYIYLYKYIASRVETYISLNFYTILLQHNTALPSALPFFSACPKLSDCANFCFFFCSLDFAFFSYYLFIWMWMWAVYTLYMYYVWHRLASTYILYNTTLAIATTIDIIVAIESIAFYIAIYRIDSDVKCKKKL